MRLKIYFSVLLLFLPLAVFAQEWKSALELGVNQIHQNLEAKDLKKQFVIQVVNYHSGLNDTTAKKIEADLYLTLGQSFPDVKLLLLSESVVGVASSEAVFVKGSYEPRGELVLLRVQALKGSMTGELLAQSQTQYRSLGNHRKKLVAVLDLDAPFLSASYKKAFSEVFRTAISQSKSFDLSNSADVDKMNPAAIQKNTGCTRDECATIIGEQLGVDRVVSAMIFKLEDDKYILSGKIIHIQNASILTSKTLEHDGSFRELNVALERLAVLLLDGIEEANHQIQSMPVQSEAQTEEPVRSQMVTSDERRRTADEFMVPFGGWGVVNLDLELSSSDPENPVNEKVSFQVIGIGVKVLLNRLFSSTLKVDSGYAREASRSSDSSELSTLYTVNGTIQSQSLSLEYNWFGDRRGKMANWSFEAGGGVFGSQIHYDLMEEGNEKTNRDLDVIGMMLSFGFDYSFNGNFALGLHGYSSLSANTSTADADLEVLLRKTTQTNVLMIAEYLF